MALAGKTISALLLACSAGMILAADANYGDPSFGGYYFYAALEKRCPEPNAARTIALDQFKRHFIANARSLIAAYPPSQTTQAVQLLEDLERNGPRPEDLTPFDSLFAKGSPREIAALCDSAATDMAERMAIEKKMSEAYRRAKAQ